MAPNVVVRFNPWCTILYIYIDPSTFLQQPFTTTPVCNRGNNPIIIRISMRSDGFIVILSRPFSRIVNRSTYEYNSMRSVYPYIMRWLRLTGKFSLPRTTKIETMIGNSLVLVRSEIVGHCRIIRVVFYYIDRWHCWTAVRTKH